MAYTTINKGSSYFNTVLYTGDGTTSRSVTGVGFQPDWVWAKGRSTAYYHGLWDAVRTNKSALYSNATDAEDTTTGGTLGSFNSDGFTTPNVSGGFINNSGTTYVAWNWLANNTSGSSNTAGTITSTVAANTIAGFSIVSYAGNSTNDATIGHGLGVAPSMVIIKNRTSALSGSAGAQWVVKHKSIGMTASGSASQLYLNLTNASSNNDHGTLITNGSTLLQIKIGSASPNYFMVGETGNNYIAYCFAEIKGFSNFGSYTGNSSSDGVFIYTGFKPAFVLLKATTNTNEWWLYDNKRNSFNPEFNRLAPNNSTTEYTTPNTMDFVSNGFKLRHPDDAWNASGNTYIYMAFAENPFVTSGGIPVTAR